jgi:hypothetical protein
MQDLKKLDNTICWNEQCPDFTTKESSRCRHKHPLTESCEVQFDISFKSDSVKPKGEPRWRT